MEPCPGHRGTLSEWPWNGVRVRPGTLSECAWNVQQTAALSAAFIVLNSLSGLLSCAADGRWPSLATAPSALAAVVGAIAGAHIGSRKLSAKGLASMLGGVLVLAGTKLLVLALS